MPQTLKEILLQIKEQKLSLCSESSVDSNF